MDWLTRLALWCLGWRRRGDGVDAAGRGYREWRRGPSYFHIVRERTGAKGEAYVGSRSHRRR